MASNHASFLDPPAVGVSASRLLSYLAREDLFQIPILGAFLRTVWCFPVRRGEQDVGAFREAVRRLKAGEAVLMFPEATRTWDGEPGEARSGVGAIALLARVPIVPVYVRGSYEAWPRHRRRFRCHPISVHFGPLMDPHQLPLTGSRRQQYEELARLVMAKIVAIKDQMRYT